MAEPDWSVFDWPFVNIVINMSKVVLSTKYIEALDLGNGLDRAQFLWNSVKNLYRSGRFYILKFSFGHSHFDFQASDSNHPLVLGHY